MSSVKTYFSDRMGRRLAWQPSKTLPVREYGIIPKSFDGSLLLVSVGYVDIRRDGSRQTMVDQVLGEVKVPLLSSPAAVLEKAARLIDADRMGIYPEAEDPGSPEAYVKERMTSLLDGKDLSDDEVAATPDSVARFRSFWATEQRLAQPALFSSKDGTIRARWNDGANKTLWISFPAKGPLGWSISIPREGNYGPRRMHAKCSDDRDIIPLAALVGIRISAS